MSEFGYRGWTVCLKPSDSGEFPVTWHLEMEFGEHLIKMEAETSWKSADLASAWARNAVDDLIRMLYAHCMEQQLISQMGRTPLMIAK